MIVEQSDRKRYIGASDNKYVSGSFDNKVFVDWWSYKIGMTDMISLDFLTPIRSGNIIENIVLDYLNISPEFRGVKKIIPGTHIGCNYDALLPTEVIEVKTMKAELAGDILVGYALPSIYKRQMDHEMYVAGLTSAKIYIMPLEKKDHINPFDIDLEKLFFKEYRLPDISDYIKRLNYLDICFKEGSIPSDKEFEKFAIELCQKEK